MGKLIVGNAIKVTARGAQVPGFRVLGAFRAKAKWRRSLKKEKIAGGTFRLSRSC